MDDEYYPSLAVRLQPCRICGRTFNPETLNRHEGICQKNAIKQRKKHTFDSRKQRAVQDLPGFSKKGSKSSVKDAKVSKSNWRQKHEDFLQTVRAARGVTKAIKEGRELPPPPPPAINPDYVQCPYCMRRFNENAADRHIQFCADQHKRLETHVKSKTVATALAAEKRERRNTYRPPMPASGLRKTMHFSNGSSGYSSSATQPRGQQKSSKKRTSTLKMGERSNTDFTRNRFNDNSIFDTSLPASAVVTTRTGLKARVFGNNSSSDIDSSDFDIPKRGPGRRMDALKATDYSSHYQPTMKGHSGRSDTTSYTVTKYDWDFNFDESSKKVSTRKSSNSKTKHEPSSGRDGAISLKNEDGHHHTGNNSDYGNSLNDLAGFRSNYRSATGSHYNDTPTFERGSSPLTDFGSKNDRYKGQGEPAYIAGKDKSFALDRSRDDYVGANQTSRFCHECGSRYPVHTAKFCCECGMRRILI